MKKLLIVLAICFCACLSGCATLPSIDPALYNFTIIETDDYNKVYDALLKVLNERGEMITLANKSDGIIITDYNYNNPASSDNFCKKWVSFKYRLNISVYNENPIKIKIVPDIQYFSSDCGWLDARDDGTILNSIKQDLSKRLIPPQ